MILFYLSQNNFQWLERWGYSYFLSYVEKQHLEDLHWFLDDYRDGGSSFKSNYIP